MPPPRTRTGGAVRVRAAIAVLAAGLALTLAWAAHRPAPAADQPYARWRNGVIVYVRNCEAPRDDEALLKCAALACARRVTEQLTNPQQARLALTSYVRSADGETIEIRGTLDQYLRAPTLPTGFTCRTRDYRRAEPEFEFGRRQAMGSL